MNELCDSGEGAAHSDDNGAPRIAIYSMRRMNNHVSRACGYGFEDVVTEQLDYVDLIQPSHSAVSPYLLKAKNWLTRHTAAGKGAGLYLNVPPRGKAYDLCVFDAAQPRDLNVLNAIGGWRENAHFAVCRLQELWIDDIARLGRLLDTLNDFDHVICSFYHTTELLRKRLSVPVTYMPWSVDAALFCPYPDPPARVIDVCNIGGIGESTHNGMREYADDHGLYYQYNTIKGNYEVASHRAHRLNYAGALKRSRYFFAHMAKVARKDERGVQEEFGLRFLEAAAAGAVLLGDRLDNPGFIEHLTWEDSIIEIPFECPQIGEVIAALDRDPERVEAARRRNICEVLRRHDHLHLWRRVLAIAGLPETPGMTRRDAQLAHLVDLAAKGESPGVSQTCCEGD